MSANILRDIVGQYFNIDPKQVRLSGEISPDFVAIQHHTSGGMWEKSIKTKIWGFNPKTGFNCITNAISAFEVNDHKDGPVKYMEIKSLANIDINGFIFFLVKVRETYSCPTNNENKKSTSWTLYKAPNFKEHLNNLEAEDIARWEQWLAE